jgi:hypothetical protein
MYSSLCRKNNPVMTRLLTRLLFVLYYSFRYIYWALIEFFTAFGKKLRVQANVESVTSEPAALGLDQVCIRYKYKVNGRTYAGSLIRECSQRHTTGKLLQRFPVGGAVWVRVDRSDPREPPAACVVLVGPFPHHSFAPLHALRAITATGSAD